MNLLLRLHISYISCRGSLSGVSRNNSFRRSLSNRSILIILSIVDGCWRSIIVLLNIAGLSTYICYSCAFVSVLSHGWLSIRISVGWRFWSADLFNKIYLTILLFLHHSCCLFRFNLCWLDNHFWILNQQRFLLILLLSLIPSWFCLVWSHVWWCFFNFWLIRLDVSILLVRSHLSILSIVVLSRTNISLRGNSICSCSINFSYWLIWFCFDALRWSNRFSSFLAISALSNKRLTFVLRLFFYWCALIFIRFYKGKISSIFVDRLSCKWSFWSANFIFVNNFFICYIFIWDWLSFYLISW